MCGIDEALKKRHLESLATPEAREMYERTLRIVQERPDGARDTDLDMIFDLCTTEEIKAALVKDISTRGAMVTTRSGRQNFVKENPSIARVCRLTEMQRKIRDNLKITPARRYHEEEEEEAEEEKDEFDAL